MTECPAFRDLIRILQAYSVKDGMICLNNMSDDTVCCTDNDVSVTEDDCMDVLREE